MATTIPCRKVYKFRMEPTGPEALELERACGCDEKNIPTLTRVIEVTLPYHSRCQKK